jgi:hypothetical protein
MSCKLSNCGKAENLHACIREKVHGLSLWSVLCITSPAVILNRGTEPQKRLKGCLRTGNMTFLFSHNACRENWDNLIVSGALLSYYPVDTGGTSPGRKETRGLKLATQLHLAPSSKRWRSTSISSYVFMKWFIRTLSFTFIVALLQAHYLFTDHKVPKNGWIDERINRYFDVTPSLYLQVLLLIFPAYIITFLTISKQEHVANHYISEYYKTLWYSAFTSEGLWLMSRILSC